MSLLQLSAESLEPIASALLAVVVYSTTGYLDNKSKRDEPIKPLKLLATVFVALLVASGSILAGDPIGQEQLGVELAAYAGVIAVVQHLLKTALPESVKRYLRDLADTYETQR